MKKQSIRICGQHGYRRHKARVLLAHNQGSTLFVDGDTPNAIVMYNFWKEHRLIVVDPNRPRHFRLDILNQEELLALNDTQSFYEPSIALGLVFHDPCG